MTTQRMRTRRTVERWRRTKGRMKIMKVHPWKKRKMQRLLRLGMSATNLRYLLTSWFQLLVSQCEVWFCLSQPFPNKHVFNSCQATQRRFIPSQEAVGNEGKKSQDPKCNLGLQTRSSVVLYIKILLFHSWQLICSPQIKINWRWC